MSIFNIFKNQLGQVIAWENQEEQQLWYKYPSKLDEIKDGSKLILEPGQAAILVYEGKMMDHLQGAGVYHLKTDNLPFITTLINLYQNFESEHKLYIYFYRLAAVTNQSWGTSTAVKYIDEKYQIPVEVGMHGNFSYQIQDAEKLYTQIIARQNVYSTDQFRAVISDRMPVYISSYLAQKKYSYQDIDSKQLEISQHLSETISQEFEDFGMELLDFKVKGIQFDEASVQRIGRVADVSIDVQAGEEAGLDYVELEKLRALRDASRNEGGLAGVAAQMAVGMEIGRLFNQEKQSTIRNIEKSEDAIEKLRKFQVLLKEEIITKEEFEEIKGKILKSI